MSSTAYPGIALFLREVQGGEADLERELREVAERHHADHEVRYVAADLARWSLENRRALVALADRYGDDLRDDQDPQRPAPQVPDSRETTAERRGRRPEPALLLLFDLRQLYLLASGNGSYWTALGQAAQAARDPELLAVVTACHDRTMRQAAWCDATIKALSPQLLTAR